MRKELCVNPSDTASESTDLDPKSKNRYDLNNASLESLHEDLAKSGTRQWLMQYVTSTCQQQVKEFDKQNYPATEERPVAEIFACLGVDGQPAAACHQILAQDATSENRKYPEHLLVSAGGFHYSMKTLNANWNCLSNPSTCFSRHGGILSPVGNGSNFQVIHVNVRKNTHGTSLSFTLLLPCS